MKAATTIADLQHGVRRLEEAKGFEISPEQRLAYPMAEVGEVAAEVLELSRDGNAPHVGKMDAARAEAAVEARGTEIHDVNRNLPDPADMAGADPERAFGEKARLNEDREW